MKNLIKRLPENCSKLTLKQLKNFLLFKPIRTQQTVSYEGFKEGPAFIISNPFNQKYSIE